MTKALYLHHSSVVGGAEKSMSELLSALAPKGIEAEVILPAEGPFAQLLRKSGVSVRTVPAPKLQKSMNPMRLMSYYTSRKKLSEECMHVVESGGAQLVHFNSLSVAVLFSEGLPEKVPTILHLRDSIVPRMVFNKLSGDLTAYVAISGYMKRVLTDFLGVQQRKVASITNGLVLPAEASPRQKELARRKLGLPPNAVIFLSAAAFVPWKNHISLLDAFRATRAKVPNSLLILCGEDTAGENEAHRKKIIATAQVIGPSVIMAGHVNNLRDYLQAADIFVHPAICEPFGRAVVEAQATGLPAIAYKSGGMEEIIENEETGLTCELEHKQFAEAMVRLAVDVKLRQAMGHAAPMIMKQKFTIERAANQVYSLYEDILAGRFPAPEAPLPPSQKELSHLRRKPRTTKESQR